MSPTVRMMRVLDQMRCDLALIGEPNLLIGSSSRNEDYAADAMRFRIKRKINKNRSVFLCEMNLEQLPEVGLAPGCDDEPFGTHGAKLRQSGVGIVENRVR